MPAQSIESENDSGVDNEFEEEMRKLEQKQRVVLYGKIKERDLPN